MAGIRPDADPPALLAASLPRAGRLISLNRSPPVSMPARYAARRPFRSFRRRLHGFGKYGRYRRVARSFTRAGWMRGPSRSTRARMPRMITDAAGRSTPASILRYGGIKEKAYTTQVYRSVARLSITASYSTIDAIQFALWSASRFSTIAGASGAFEYTANAHDQYRLVYSGVRVTPMWSTAQNYPGPIQTGDVFLMPVSTDNTYRFAAQAAAVSPVFKPPYLSTVMEAAPGSQYKFQGTLPQRTMQQWQRGFSYQHAYMQPVWNQQSGFDNTYLTTTLRPSGWESVHTTVNGTQQFSGTQFWGPLCVWCNWGASSNNPFIFEIEVIYKFAFKDKRLDTDAVAVTGKSDPEAEEKKADPDSGFWEYGVVPGWGVEVHPQVQFTELAVEPAVDDDVVEIDDEKENGGVSVPPPQKKPALSRGMTNLNLGSQAPPRVTKRTSEMSQK